MGDGAEPTPEEPLLQSSRVKRGPSAPVPDATPLPPAPAQETVSALQPLAASVDRHLVACDVPHWLDPEDYSSLRPGWVSEGVVHLMVGPGESQRTLYATPRLSLSYTLDEVQSAATDPELRAAILAEAQALPSPKEVAPLLLGSIRWTTGDDGKVGRCAIHPAENLVSLTVYVEDTESRLVDAYVRAGESGARTSGGTAVFDVVGGQPVRVTASSAAGSAALSVTPGEGTELILTLEDLELPASGGLIDWDAALRQASSGADPQTRAVLAQFDTFIREGDRDELQDALTELAKSGPKPQDKGRRGRDKSSPMLVPLTP